MAARLTDGKQLPGGADRLASAIVMRLTQVGTAGDMQADVLAGPEDVGVAQRSIVTRSEPSG